MSKLLHFKRHHEEHKKTGSRLREKCLQNIYLIKGCYPIYTKNFHNSTIRKQTTQLQYGPRILTEDIQMPNESMKRRSTAHVIQGMQTETRRCRYTPGRTAKTRVTDNVRRWWGCAATGILSRRWWGCKVAQSLWRTTGRFLTQLNIISPCVPAAGPWYLSKGAQTYVPAKPSPACL